MPTFPLFNGVDFQDGSVIEFSRFCKEKLRDPEKCVAHYAQLRDRAPGWYQCPYGLSCRSFFKGGSLVAFTGMVAAPRFGTDEERRIAKAYPEIRTSRKLVDEIVASIEEIELIKADAILESSKVLPQAFHELRKLNGAVLQMTEREITDKGPSRYLQTVKSASELMRNNFDILEALANLDAMRALPLDSTVNLFDLAFKVKRVYGDRAAEREMSISIDGVRAVINGSQKSFPIVPAVLIENAIKYGVRGTHIYVEISAERGRVVLVVRNTTKEAIDPVRCFERGRRFSTIAEGGGFGLYLAQQIVTSHNGTITCEVGEGTVSMIVDLPLRTVITTRSK